MSSSLKKTMAKNLSVGHKFTTSRRGYSTPTLKVLSISPDPDRNELGIRVEDHLGNEERLILRAFQEVSVLNWGNEQDAETRDLGLKPIRPSGSRCRCPDPSH